MTRENLELRILELEIQVAQLSRDKEELLNYNANIRRLFAEILKIELQEVKGFKQKHRRLLNRLTISCGEN